MATSKISWCDRVWNPVVGCTRVSAGCENCYAEALAPRLAAMGRPEYEGLTKRHYDGSVNWTGEVRCLPERLEMPLRWKKPQRVFVNSMSDLFHEAVPSEFIDQVFRTMKIARHHTFMILTKRPERMREYVSERWTQDLHRVRDEGLWGPLLNVWLGVSTENQETAEARIPILLRTPAAVRFISAEPLLGPLELTEWFAHYVTCLECGAEQPFSTATCYRCGKRIYDPGLHRTRPRIKWVIVGGESGSKHRPMDLGWARSIRDQCDEAGVAFFYKQGSSQWPGQDDMLDGREWREFPA